MKRLRQLGIRGRRAAYPPREEFAIVRVSGLAHTEIYTFNNRDEMLAALRKFTPDEQNFIDLRWTNLSGADLRGIDLRWALLNQSNLDNADLRGAKLTNANLSETSMHHAKLDGADLNGAMVYDADLSNAQMSNAQFASTMGTPLTHPRLNASWLDSKRRKNERPPASCPWPPKAA